MNHRLFAALAPLLLALESTAEVLTVDDDGTAAFLDIQPAIDAASPGDLILVEPGTYGPFELDRDLSVVGNGETPADVVVLPTNGDVPALRLRPTGAGSVAFVSNLTVLAPTVESGVLLADDSIEVPFSQGTVVLSEVVVDRSAASGSKLCLEVSNGPRVVLERCTFLGSPARVVAFGTGLVSTAAGDAAVFLGSSVSAVDCVFRGGLGTQTELDDAASNPVPGARGITVTGFSELDLVDCEIYGGGGGRLTDDGVIEVSDGGIGLAAFGSSSKIRLAGRVGCRVVGGSGLLAVALQTGQFTESQGGAGCAISTGASLEAGSNASFLGGSNGTLTGVADDLLVDSASSFELRSIRLPGASPEPALLAPGGDLQVEFRGQPLSFHLAYFAPDVGDVQLIPGLSGLAWLTGPELVFVGGSLLDSEGTGAPPTLGVPDSPSLTGATGFVQTVQRSGTRLDTAPPIAFLIGS